MLKKFFITCLLIIFIIMNLCITICYAESITLSQIVDTFNNCSTVKENATHGSIWNATTTDNKIVITLSAGDTNTNLEYILDGTILSVKFTMDDAITGAVVTSVLADCIGQLHGYEEGELFNTLNSDKISSYTVDNEGFEAKQLEDGSFEVKIDIEKKIPLIDFSDTYIEVSDLENMKKFISGDGSVEKSKGKIWFNKSGYNGKNTLLVAEEGELTDNTYKSILSIIEVMFDSSKAADYFKSNYSGISVGNKEFTGFKIEIEPTKTEFEESLISADSGYKLVRITIDKNLANSAINGTVTDQKEDVNNQESDNKQKDEDNLVQKDTKTENSNENVGVNDSTVHSGELPKTGQSKKILYSIFIITLVMIISIKQFNKYKDIK